MAKDPWDEPDPWDVEDAAPAGYGPTAAGGEVIRAQGPINPLLSSDRNTPEEFAHNQAIARSAGIPVEQRQDAPPMSRDDLLRKMRDKPGSVTLEEFDKVPWESDSDSFVKSVAAGGVQGLTLGNADELSGMMRGGSIGSQGYKAARDQARDYFDRAQAASPLGYKFGQFGGGVALGAAMPAMGAVGNALTGAAMGAAQGFGESRAEDPKVLLRDAAVGGVVGGVTAGIGGALAGGKAADASSRVNQRLVDDLGLRATKTQRNNIALVGKRYANETADMASVADEVDEAMEAALQEADALTPGSAPVSSRKVAKVGAKKALADKADVQRTIANLARDTGLDPFAAKPTELLGATQAIIEKNGARIGAIDDATTTVTGGVKTAEIKDELRSIAKEYARVPGKLGKARRENIESLINDFDEIYAPGITRDERGVLIAPGPGGPTIPVGVLRSTKSQIAKSAYMGNAAANPSIAKEGEQELAAALNRVLKRHIEEAGKQSPELGAMVAELPQLNKEFSFAKAVEGAAKYRSMGEVNSETGLRDIMKKYGGGIGQARAIVEDVARPAAQKRDEIIAGLMRMGESESEAKRLAAKIIGKGIQGAPSGIRSTAVGGTSDFSKQPPIEYGKQSDVASEFMPDE